MLVFVNEYELALEDWIVTTLPEVPIKLKLLAVCVVPAVIVSVRPAETDNVPVNVLLPAIVTVAPVILKLL